MRKVCVCCCRGEKKTKKPGCVVPVITQDGVVCTRMEGDTKKKSPVVHFHTARSCAWEQGAEKVNGFVFFGPLAEQHGCGG